MALFRNFTYVLCTSKRLGLGAYWEKSNIMLALKILLNLGNGAPFDNYSPFYRQLVHYLLFISTTSIFGRFTSLSKWLWR